MIYPETIDLATNDQTKTLKFEKIEKFSDGSGYASWIKVVSGGFSCWYPFYFDVHFLRSAIRAIGKMIRGKSTEALIKAEFEEDFVQIQSNDLGHVFVSGIINEQGETTQRFRFEFRTDQTVLSPLLVDLKKLNDAK